MWFCGVLSIYLHILHILSCFCASRVDMCTGLGTGSIFCWCAFLKIVDGFFCASRGFCRVWCPFLGGL